MLQIGSIQIVTPVVAAPMAGVSDRPYRSLARQMGAGLAVSEMLASQPHLRETTKTKNRMNIHAEQGPVSVQLVGTEPELLAEAASFNVGNGADIIDINMGCPAKKVCKKLAGSALLSNEQLVGDILQSVVAAVDVPVTLKIRTGVSPNEKNAVKIAKIAEDSGIKALTIHGRTRQCRFVGDVEYETIADVKQSVSIPIIANGDINSPENAADVLKQTGADAVMIGRAAQGRPWLFGQIADYLECGEYKADPSVVQKSKIIMEHVCAIHAFYGDRLGVKFARKHIAWYLNNISADLRPQRAIINQQQSPAEQLECLRSTLEDIQNILISKSIVA